MGYWKIVEMVIEKSDIVIEVLDARIVDETRNHQIEKMAKEQGKLLLYVINKCDLAKKEDVEKKKNELIPSIFISSKNRIGTTMLKKKILEIAKKKHVIVGVCGYPNTGKSSIINALAGRSKARTSSESGFTRGMQYVRAGPRIMLIDTPGVIPYDDKDEAFLAIIGAKDSSKLKMPDVAAYKIIDMLKGGVEDFYGVKHSDDPEETLVSIALKMGRLLKGGNPDIDAAARIIVRDWQMGILSK